MEIQVPDLIEVLLERFVGINGAISGNDREP